MSRKNATPVTDEVIEELEAPAEVTFSAKEVALELGTDAKSFRRWLRAHTTERANKGGRWLFSPEGKAAIIAAYQATPDAIDPELDTDA